MLVVDGDMTISGSNQWDGVILVGGKLTSNGNNVTSGTVMAGLNRLIGIPAAAGGRRHAQRNEELPVQLVLREEGDDRHGAVHDAPQHLDGRRRAVLSPVLNDDTTGREHARGPSCVRGLCQRRYFGVVVPCSSPLRSRTARGDADASSTMRGAAAP